MNKQSFITILLTMLMNMTGAKAFAYDFAVPNSDGVYICYVWANSEKTELAVTYSSYSTYTGRYSNYYSGNVVIPESVIYEGNSYKVTSIGEHAFVECKNLTSVTIPNSITSIKFRAFWCCTSLTSVSIPSSVTSIGSDAFEGCSGLTAITISNGVISIGSGAFHLCKQLTSVTIPNSVTTIGSSAFSGCSSLPFITIPNGVTTIGSGAFNDCNNLTSVAIPKSVTSIGENAFSGCSNLTSVIIGSGVTSIGNDAFSKTNLKKTIWLTNTPPSGYKNASGSINYVSNDQFTSLSNTVKYQFLSSYFDVDGIRYVPVSPSERTCDAIDCVYDESEVNTMIASTVAYKGVSMNVKNLQPYLAYNNMYIKTLTASNDGELPNYAFTNCSNMQSVTLGQKVSAIGSYAFQGCSSLEAVAVPDIVTELNDYTFDGCSSLQEVKIGSQMQTINQYAFGGCSSLPSITIPNAVTNIYNNVFYNCTGLKNVNIADSESTLTFGSNGSNPIFSSCPLDYVYIGRDISYSTSSNIGYSPFYRNTTLREVKITDKETEISENEFYGCTNLQKITIGDGVTSIGKRAFSGASSLRYFAFGSQVVDIGEEAFSDCAAVIEITSKAATPPVCGAQALDDINKWECKLYVPKGKQSAYQAADQWKDFFFSEEGEGTSEQNPDGQPTTDKCKTPIITIVDGKIHFSCDTKGVGYTYNISATSPSGAGNDVTPSSLTLTVYASKPGFEDSDVASKEIDINLGIRGDLNNDNSVNVADHVELSKIIMNQNNP